MGQPTHTVFAGQAVGLAELFKYNFAKKRLAGAAGYAVELSAPEGPSTSGGKQPLQHVKLVPETGAIMVVGTINVVDKHVELRSHRHMDEVHRQRFKGAPLGADAAQYSALIDEMRAFFAGHQYTVSMQDGAPTKPMAVSGSSASRPVPASSRPAAAPAVAKLPSRSPMSMIFVVAATAATVATVGAMFLRR
jgi:hypothetical protein